MSVFERCGSRPQLREWTVERPELRDWAIVSGHTVRDGLGFWTQSLCSAWFQALHVGRWRQGRCSKDVSGWEVTSEGPGEMAETRWKCQRGLGDPEVMSSAPQVGGALWAWLKKREVETQWSSGCLQSREPSSVLKTGASGQFRWKETGMSWVWEDENPRRPGFGSCQHESQNSSIYHKFSAYQA